MIGSMPLSISEVATQIGLRPSTIRYYEHIGILPPASESVGSDDTMSPPYIGW
jgi:hypothetical protein